MGPHPYWAMSSSIAGPRDVFGSFHAFGLLISSSLDQSARPSDAEWAVPDLHGRDAAIVTEHAQGARAEQEVLPRANRQTKPARDEHAQHVAMGKQRDVTRGGLGSRDRSIRPLADVLRRFSIRASIPEDQPAGGLSVNLTGGQTLIPAVVPFDQIGIHDRAVAEPGQGAGFPSPLQGTGEDEGKRFPGKNRPQPLRKPTTVVGQWDVCDPRVLPAQAPRRLTVPDREDVHAGPPGDSNVV